MNIDLPSVLEFHKGGKVALQLPRPVKSVEDLCLAYTPGVGKAVLDLAEHPEHTFDYSAKGHTVAVVSDGTAILGLGDRGPTAAIPVMEGKCVLFKRFAGIDAWPLCLNKVFGEDGRTDPKKLIAAVETLEPSFGGINLEDIGAPACFEVEPALKKAMNIPVFHDDQHGTAIISLSGILNALKIVGKNIADCKFVMNGAGAAGIACAEFYILAGADRAKFTLCDSKGVIHAGRTDLNEQKRKFAHETSDRTLEEAIRGADVFVGVSVAGALTPEMVATMAPGAVVFAMANPTPEILPDQALKAGAAVVGTGRSDFCNQVNNVLGFPGIFRGALDTRAKDINEAMKLAASHALASIANEKMPEDIRATLVAAYPEEAAAGVFDGEIPLKSTFVIPKPFDVRVVPRVARMVAKAAMDTGVAQVMIDDLDAYEASVKERIAHALEA